jgi:hypothetical protein
MVHDPLIQTLIVSADQNQMGQPREAVRLTCVYRYPAGDMTAT